MAAYFSGAASGKIDRSTLSDNLGGGMHSHSASDLIVTNSTFSSNVGGRGAIFNGKRDGFDISDNSSFAAALSGDAAFVAFYSEATNLVPGDTNGLSDIFVYDRLSDTVERVSVSSDGNQANSVSINPELSFDGRFVVFESLASNLVPGDTNAVSDVFFHDRQTGTTERISKSSSGVQGNRASDMASMTPDGRFVSFDSDATNLVSGDTNDTFDIFVYDRVDATLERVSLAHDGSEANGASITSSLSDDGRFVAFDSIASNLVPGDTNDSLDVFVYARDTGAVERISVSDDGSEAVGGTSTRPVISSDGRFVAFVSEAFNLVPNDFNGRSDIFVYDRDNNTIERVSVHSDGTEANAGSASSDSFSNALAISDDGRFVAFHSDATNLVDGDTNGVRDIFVHDRQNGTTERVSVASDGTQGNALSSGTNLGLTDFLSLSSDGRFVGFHSLASNIVPGDTNERSDVFVYDRLNRQLTAPNLTATESTIHATQVTIANGAGAQFSVSGSVQLEDVLLANDRPVDEQRVSLVNVIRADVLGADLIGPLDRVGYSTPVHRLLAGNPAIDSGNTSFASRIDQRGVTRNVPDVGAFEADAAAVSGKVFVDVDEDQALGIDEHGIPDVVVRAASQSGDPIVRAATSIGDSSGTSDVDESGLFSFGDLPRGDYVFEVVPPTGWSLSQPVITRIPSFQPDGPSFARTERRWPNRLRHIGGVKSGSWGCERPRGRFRLRHSERDH